MKTVAKIPANKAWLFKNKKALASIKRGLKQSTKKRTINLGSFANYATM